MKGELFNKQRTCYTAISTETVTETRYFANHHQVVLISSHLAPRLFL